jgi:hypothetical protein
MRQAGGWHNSNAVAGVVVRAAVARTTAVRNSPILFFI